MYPYNRNDDTIVKSKTASLSTRETTKNLLSKDKQLLALLSIALEDAEYTGSLYEALSRNQNLGRDVEVLRNAYLDELKHSKQLQDVYFQITSEKIPKSTSNAEKRKLPNELGLALEALLLEELENSDFYRDLLLLMPVGALRDILFEIMSDKLDHSIRLSYLYAKHK